VLTVFYFFAVVLTQVLCAASIIEKPILHEQSGNEDTWQPPSYTSD